MSFEYRFAMLIIIILLWALFISPNTLEEQKSLSFIAFFIMMIYLAGNGDD